MEEVEGGVLLSKLNSDRKGALCDRRRSRRDNRKGPPFTSPPPLSLLLPHKVTKSQWEHRDE